MKIKMVIPKEGLQKAINEVEATQIFTNRTDLSKAVESHSFCVNFKPKPITAAVVIARIREFGLECKTPLGKRGRQKGETIVRTNKPKKTSTEANNALTKYMGPKYKSLADKIIGGSRQAATKAYCIQCVGFENVAAEIRNCKVLSCPLYNFRPYN